MKITEHLGIEHRMIEEMLDVIQTEIERIETLKDIDSLFLSKAIDSIITYAEQTHHMKEETIFFSKLAKKDLSTEEITILKKLQKDHAYNKSLAQELITARDEFINGKIEHIEKIVKDLKALIEFYPAHLKLEEETFFKTIERHFNEEERKALEEEAIDFDRRAIHKTFYADIKSAKKSRKLAQKLKSEDLDRVF